MKSNITFLIYKENKWNNMKHINSFDKTFETNQTMVIKRSKFNQLKKLISKVKSNIGDESELTDAILKLEKMIENIDKSC